MDEGIIALVAICLIFGPGLLAVWSRHKQKLLELEIQREQARGLASSSNIELETLKQELAELRRTTTEYDLSIDSHLQQMKQRIEFLEQRTHEMESQQHIRG
ncbi:MAG: hypothetical protein KIT45_03950 [Fimbriimonadia bacterium]|nr:hypothetical protein [Fimbriimonadia bacterium]